MNTYTTAPQCAGWIGDHRCDRQLDDGQDDGRWLTLLGRFSMPVYFICPACETGAMAEWIDRQLGEDGRAGGCAGMVRLESGTPGEVLGMVRDDFEDETP